MVMTNTVNISPLKFHCVADWADMPIPERKWLVEGVIPRGEVTILSGHGGTGKSLLALQLMLACSAGDRWLGLPTLSCPSYGIFCEESQEELMIRMNALCIGMDFGKDARGRMYLMSGKGMENMLGISKGKNEVLEPTQHYRVLREYMKGTEAQLLVLDSLYDVFAGNENNRTQARQFINLLCSLAGEMDAAIVIVSHPSLTGITNKTGLSGSTAWHNACRAMLYLDHPAQEDGAEDIRRKRVLTVIKSNYAAPMEDMRLDMGDGYLVPELNLDSGMTGSIRRRSAERVFIECMKEAKRLGERVSSKQFANNYAPRVFMKFSQAAGQSAHRLDNAMWKLLQAGVLSSAEDGPPSRRYAYLELKQEELWSEYDGPQEEE